MAGETAGEESRGVLSMDQLCSALGNWGMQMTAFTVPREHLGLGIQQVGCLTPCLLIGLEET